MADSAAALGAGARVGADLRRRTPRGLLLRLATRARRPWLDGEIARGAVRPGDRALELREAQLVEARERTRLASRFEEILTAGPGSRGISSAIPLDDRAVRVAEPLISELIRILRSSELVDPRGVVLGWRLFTDPASPIYRLPPESPGNPDHLWYEAQAVLFALRPLAATTPTRAET